MAGRYGERTRVTQAIPNWGQVSAGGGSWVFYEQEFTSPGTWTKPATVTTVDVIVVGGGGGGGAGWWRPGTPQGPTGRNYGLGGGGGGGQVTYIEGWPVTGPVPVTVGSGGTGGRVDGPDGTTGLASASTPGGQSAFGPTSPPLANSVISGGGNGGGSAGAPAAAQNYVQPAVASAGGMGGPICIPSPAAPLSAPTPTHNTPTNYPSGASGWAMRASSRPETHVSGGGVFPVSWGAAGDGLYGFGGGGGSDNSGVSHGGGRGGGPSGPGLAENGLANTGGGGGGGAMTAVPVVITVPTPNFAGNGGNGGSGIVIVGWWESA